MKTTVYINPDEKVILTSRTLVEVALPDDLPDEEFQKVIEYFVYQTNPNISDTGCVCVNPDCCLSINEIDVSIHNIEGVFWIPPTQEFLESSYSNAPKCILDALQGAFIHAKENSLEDYGYALIGFF